MKVIKAPNSFYSIDLHGKRIFLGGSIEMGTAENWQDRLTNELKHFDEVILNPRRDDWDSSWEQSISNDKFREQVLWELKAQEYADLRVYYFDPATKSPITLLEIGLFKDKKNIVCCPDGYWRKGNVEIVCLKYNIPLVHTFEHLLDWLKVYLS